VNAAWLARGLVACGAWVPQPGWWALVLRVAVACALLAGGLWWLRGQVDWLGLQAHWGRRAGLLLAMLLASGLAYLATLSALGWRWRSLLRQH